MVMLISVGLCGGVAVIIQPMRFIQRKTRANPAMLPKHYTTHARALDRTQVK
jgi:hypothetical protein